MGTVGDEEIGRLDVPVNDAATVGRVERVGNLPGKVEDAVDRFIDLIDPTGRPVDASITR